RRLGGHRPRRRCQCHRRRAGRGAQPVHRGGCGRCRRGAWTPRHHGAGRDAAAARRTARRRGGRLRRAHDWHRARGPRRPRRPRAPGAGAARARRHEDGARAGRRGRRRGAGSAGGSRADGRSRCRPGDRVAHRERNGAKLMSTEEPVRYEIRGRAAWITLASPATRNALSGPMIDALGRGLERAIDDAAVRVIVLTGTGPVFCAGADLKGGGAAVTQGGGGRNPFVTILSRLWDGPKPVVVAANGNAFGGGVGLIAAADIAIAVEGGTFAFSEVRVGVIPAMISVVVLPK